MAGAMIEPPYLANDVSLRDWFAGQALAGMLLDETAGEPSDAALAARCYGIADAFLNERAKAVTP